MNVVAWDFYALLHHWQVCQPTQHIHFALAIPDGFSVADCLTAQVDATKMTVTIGFAPELAMFPDLVQAWLWQVYRCHQVTHYLWHIAPDPLDATTAWLYALTGYARPEALSLQQQFTLLPWLYSADISEHQLNAMLCTLLPVDIVTCMPLSHHSMVMNEVEQSSLGQRQHQLGSTAWLGCRLPYAQPVCRLILTVQDRYHFLPGRHWRKTLDALLAWLLPAWHIEMVFVAPSTTPTLRVDRPPYLGWTAAL